MIYLIGSIVLTSWLTLGFKVVEKIKVSRLQAIVFNYIFCVITGSLLNGHANRYAEDINQNWFPWACVMGAVFILLFSIIAFTAQQVGVAVTSVANKLSLIIPFIFSIYLYDERATWLKVVGIGVALLAVILTCLTQGQQGAHKTSRWLFILPVLLFFGSGMLDTMIKFVEYKFLDSNNVNEYLITAFTMAALLGIVSLIIQYALGKEKFSWKAVAMGACIGIPNYFSIWCLMEVLKQYASNSSAIIPINNMGVVLFSAVVARFVFRERLSYLNWVGIILSLGAIALVAYG